MMHLRQVHIEVDDPTGVLSFAGDVMVQIESGTADDGPVLVFDGVVDAVGVLSDEDSDTFVQWEPCQIPDWVIEKAVDRAMEEVNLDLS